MKKILLLLMLCASYISWGQKYEIKLKGTITTSGHSVSCDHWFRSHLYFNDGSKIDILYINLRNLNNHKFNINTTPIIIEKSKLDKLNNIYFDGSRGREVLGFFNIVCKTYSSFNNYLNVKGACQTTNFRNIDNGRNGVLTYNSNIDFIVKPIVNIKSDYLDNIKGNDDYMDISVADDSKGFPSDVYQWEYQVVDYKNGENIKSNGWRSMPSHTFGKESFKIKPNEILPNEQIIGKRIFFRIRTCNGESQNKIFYNITLSSPKILASTPTPPVCFGDKGSVQLTTDRTALPNEKMKFYLNNADIEDLDPTLYSQIVEQIKKGQSITIPNLTPGEYTLKIGGEYNGNPTYTGEAQTHKFTIKETKPVDFFIASQQNVFCHGGSDGSVVISATGEAGRTFQYTIDNGITWVNFDKPNQATIPNLKKGNYSIRVRDSQHCPAKENAGLGKEKILSVNISEPSEPVSISDTEIVQPKGYGLSNGYISVTVKGGTPKADGSYNYEWRKDSPTGAILTNVTTSLSTPDGFSFRLNNVSAGKYYLTIKDKNFADASSKIEACGVVSTEFIVTQPDPLISTIFENKKISCHIGNIYDYKADLNANNIPDEAEDGGLKSTTKGGVAPYSYQWQKEINGTFQDISGETDPEIQKQGAGRYKIIVTDKNGNTTSEIFTLNYPNQLKLALKANDLLCHNGNNGSVEVTASGGTGNYTYRWNTLDRNPRVSDLSAGNYFVIVSDENHCKAKGNITINEPNEILVNDILVQDPISHKGANGKIQIGVNGGKAPYHISWSNGMTGSNISGLVAGSYTATIEDANHCSITKTYTLTDPEKIALDLGDDIVTLCLGDTQNYDVTINDRLATYTWTDASGNVISNQPKISLSKEGKYFITIVNSKGNTASDSVEIKLSSDVLSPEFMVTTHAYVEAPIKLVNISPANVRVLEWVIPQNKGITILSQSDEYLELLFSDTGTYSIGLKGTQGTCQKTFYKDITIDENINGINLNYNSVSNIKDFTIAPNPNNGQFKVLVKLLKEDSVRVRIIDMVSHQTFPKIEKPKGKEFEIPFYTTLPASTYLVILETGKEVLVKKMIVN